MTYLHIKQQVMEFSIQIITTFRQLKSEPSKHQPVFRVGAQTPDMQLVDWKRLIM